MAKLRTVQQHGSNQPAWRKGPAPEGRSEVNPTNRFGGAECYLARSGVAQYHWFGTTPIAGSDPAVYAAICALLLCVGLLAVVLPAYQASRVGPVIALRQE
jgi:hypothetical protein